MSLLEKINTKETNEKTSEEKRKIVDKEVRKLREYEKLGGLKGRRSPDHCVFGVVSLHVQAATVSVPERSGSR